MEVLARFAGFEASIEELRSELRRVFEFDFDSPIRTAATHFQMPEPGVLVTKAHITDAFERKRSGAISDVEFVSWATMLLLNDGYEIDRADEDRIADKLNAISFGEIVTES
jgi:hypothetical protein